MADAAFRPSVRTTGSGIVHNQVSRTPAAAPAGAVKAAAVRPRRLVAGVAQAAEDGDGAFLHDTRAERDTC